MYTFLMRSDKTLAVTNKSVIYQRDKLVDKVKFYIPTTYEDINLEDFSVLLKYIDQNNIVHVINLTKAETDKEGFMKYVIEMDTNLTKESGDIRIHLTLNKVDM